LPSSHYDSVGLRFPIFTPLTLSSPTKATLLWIILWRYCVTAGHGSARRRAAALNFLDGYTFGRCSIAITAACFDGAFASDGRSGSGKASIADHS